MSRTRLVCFVLPVVVAVMVAPTASAEEGWTLIGWNDLGMHCMDADFGVFSILPPYNTIHAQLIDPRGELVTDPDGITVSYEAVADADGSVNTTSAGKTNFWDHVTALFGVTLATDRGLAGHDMPGVANAPQPMVFQPDFNWYTAEGIPLTPYDDAGFKNYYPLMRLVARDGSGQVLATTDIVLPVSDEMTCRSCHASGSGPAAEPDDGWAFDGNPERDYRLNALLLHDDRQAGNPTFSAALAAAGYNELGLYATAAGDGRSVLCAACHGSNALPGTGMPGISMFTAAMHGAHRAVLDPESGMVLDASDNRNACYTCHPGSETRCLRGAMGNAVAADGSLAIQCQSCHGSMSAVGAVDRQGWFDEPNCQSCHTGTAVDNNGQIRFLSSFDDSGAERVAVNDTFATDPDTPLPGFSLFRFSTGHGGVQCEGCHGSTHAVFPSNHANDNVQSVQLQGHVGVLAECESCHGEAPETNAGGPHGMHTIGREWVGRHGDAAENNPAACRDCHGLDYRGTVLSRALGDRVLDTEFGRKELWRGFQVGCYTCHNGPFDDDHSTNRAPVVEDLTVSTLASQAVPVALQASDPDGDPLDLRVVGQAVNGTVGLVSGVATYYPSESFNGVDWFTYAAWDGSTQSNLGTVTVSVSDASCSLSCEATVPSDALQGAVVPFESRAASAGCDAAPAFRWDFGDGSAASTNPNASHVYAAAGSYQWDLSVTADGQLCARGGTINVASGSQCSVACSAEVASQGKVREPVEFHGDARSTDCEGDTSFEWRFGDDTPVAQGKEVKHRYVLGGRYTWRLRVLRDGASCETMGSLIISDPRIAERRN